MTVAPPPPTPPEGPYTSAPSGNLKRMRWPGDWFGNSCLAMLLLGAGTCVFVGIKAMVRADRFRSDPELATVELILRANPDLEEVGSNRDAKTIAVRDKRSGKVTTATFDDIKAGKFSKEGSFGGTSELPAWLAYPGSSPVSGFTVDRSFNRESVTTVTTTDSVERVLSFYHRELDAHDFSNFLSLTFNEFERTTGGSLDAKSIENGHVSVAVVEQGPLTSITVVHKLPK